MAQKNHLIEMVLLKTHIIFTKEIRLEVRQGDMDTAAVAKWHILTNKAKMAYFYEQRAITIGAMG